MPVGAAFAIRAFKQALNNCGQVFACDASPDAPALQIADKGFVVPPADADNYLDVLLTICREQRVRLLIPALEPELPLLAAHRARFLEIGTLPLVSSPEIVAICYDKLETATFLDRCGLAAPRSLCSARSCAGSSFARRNHFPARGETALGSQLDRACNRRGRSGTRLRFQDGGKARSPVRFSLRPAPLLQDAAF